MILDVRIDGFAHPVGALVREDNGDVSFGYSADHLAQERAAPISLCLPLREAPFGGYATRAFFGNLLNENDDHQRLIDRERLERNDIVGILYHLGADCAGAISCLPAGAPPAKVPGLLSTDYDFLDEAQIIDIARRLADRAPLPDAVRDPSPVAGVQRKIALVATADGRFALPKRRLGAPTTHILKVPSKHDARESDFEAAAARLAAKCGLDAATSAAIDLGGVRALLATRYDRVVDQTGLVRRLHQEDFAQALGLPSSMKYQRNSRYPQGFSFSNVLSILRQCVEPAIALQTFLRTTVFNLAIGNSDNHAKNHALLYDLGNAPRMAPLYDLLPIRASAKHTHEFAFKIGAALSADDLTRQDFASFLREAGMTEAAATGFVNREVAALLKRLDRAVDAELAGMKDFADLIGTEMRRLKDVLGLEISLTERDYFMPQAPGWASG